MKQQKKPSVVKIKKYTIERTLDDIKNIDKIRKYLEQNGPYYKSFKSDSKIYRELPNLFLNTVKDNHQLQQDLDKLTVKLQDLDDLKSCFYRINEICKEVKK